MASSLFWSAGAAGKSAFEWQWVPDVATSCDRFSNRGAVAGQVRPSGERTLEAPKRFRRMICRCDADYVMILGGFLPAANPIE
jgi:hypothetical protein